MSYQVDSYGNAYFPAGVSVASIPATTGTQAKVLVPGVNGRISSATVAQLITQSGGNLVSSIFGRTGAVVAKEGDYTTDQITETGGALYFSTSRARKSIFLTTFNTSGPATYDTNTGILNIPQYGSGSGSVGNYVPLTRTITINGQVADLSVDRIFSVASMVYPSAGIPLSNGTSWGTSIVNNSANWNTAYGWGNHAGLYVPYIGATTIVNLGTNDISAGHFNATGDGGGGVLNLFKAASRTVGGSDAANTISVWADGTSLAFNDWVAGNTRSVKFSVASITNNATRTYTLPNADGTLALTSDIPSITGLVPYTGATNNLGLGIYSITAATGSFTSYILNDGSILMKNVGKTSTSSGYNTFYSLASGFGFGFADFAGNDSIFTFSATGDYTYTFPAATGTIALTSNLSTYVPYTGATTDLVLGANNFSAKQVSILKSSDGFGGFTSNYLFLQTGSSTTNVGTDGISLVSKPNARALVINYDIAGVTRGATLDADLLTAGRTFQFPNASGTIALTSDIVTYTLPTATSTILGGVKIGAGVTITSGVISVSTNYEAPITAGTTSEYWRGDKSWQTLPIYTLAGLNGQAQLNGTGFVKASGTTITYDNSTYYLASNPSGYISSYTETDTLASVTARGASTSTAVIINNSLAVNHSSHYDSAQFSLDVNGGLLVKNVGKTALFLLINSNPATGGNNAFVQHTVGGTLSSSFATIQGYYGASITGSTVLKLNPLGGDVLIGTLIGTGTRMVVANASGVVSTQAIPSVSTIAWTSVTGRPTALSQFTNDLGNYGGWITSYTETDTLASVTSRGASTTSNIVVGNISFQGVGGNSGQSAPSSDYRIYQAPGAWAHPYPDLNIAWHTGISIGAYLSYGGIRFYNNSDMVTETFSVNNGDNHVRVAYNLYVTGTVTGSNLSGTNTGDQTLPTLSSLNGQPQLNGTGFVKAVGTTISYDNSTYYLASNPNFYITSSATSLSLTGNLTVSTGNTTGGGIIFADDGDMVDLNDAYLSLRFSYGVRIFSANKGGTAVITLANTGAITATGNISAANFSGTHSGSSSGSNTGDQTNITGLAGSETLATVTGRGATTSTAVIINNNLAVNTASPYATSTYSLDINGGLLVKNTGRASNITLINADPSGGGNHAFVIHTVSGTFGSSLVDIQGYYGANVVGSTTIRLNPLGGNVTINGYTVYHSGNIPTLNQNTTGSAGSVAWTNVTGRPTTVSSFTNDSGYITSDSTKLPLVGGTLTGNLLFANSGTTKRGIQGTVGDNDFWFIGGGATGSNAGFLEIATGDDGQGASAEPIYVRQYGPGDVLTGTLVRTASLLDASGNTSFPGILSASNLSGTNTGDQTNISGTANYANQLYLRTASASVYNANTADLGVFSNYYGGGQISNIPDATYGSLYTFGGYNNTSLSLQLWSAVNHNSTSSTRTLYFRMGNNLGFQNDWKTLIDSTTIGSQSVSYATSAGYSGYSGYTSGYSTSVELAGGNYIYFNGSGNHNVRMSESYGIVMNCVSHPWHVQVTGGSFMVGMQASGGSYGIGNGYFTGDVTAYYSDKRLKHELNPIENALDKLISITGYTYKHNTLGQQLLGENPNKVHAGLVAQEVQKILPEVVTIAPFDLDGYDNDGQGISKSGENYLTIKYERIVPLLIQGIKEQQAQIEEMKKEIKELKNK